MKQWYASKTLWFNIVTAVVAIAAAFLDPSTHLFTNKTAISIFTAVVIVGNVVLRVFFTTQAIDRGQNK